MCLKRVLPIKHCPKIRIGYKVFEKLGKGPKLCGPYFDSQNGYSVNKLIVDGNNECISTFNGKKYAAGFHIFLDKEDAVSYQQLLGDGEVRVVKFGKVVAYGKHRTNYGDCNLADCVIAKEMTILPKRNKYNV